MRSGALQARWSFDRNRAQPFVTFAWCHFGERSLSNFDAGMLAARRPRPAPPPPPPPRIMLTYVMSGLHRITSINLFFCFVLFVFAE